MKRLSVCAIAAIGIAVFIACVAPAWAASNKVYNPVINPADFVQEINNLYLPLIPGTTFIYEAHTANSLIRNVVTVTDQTKQIMEVNCTVVHDIVTVDGIIEEDTNDWYAQDKDGNVWYFGEFATQFQDGLPVGHEGSWEADVNGAKPGIVMLADPLPGQSYRQEFQKGVAEDMAKVLNLNSMASVPYGDFKDCLLTKEWSPLEKGVVEYKFYAPGVGLALILEHKGKTVRMELVDIQ
jgi:hypothetical protein